MGATSTAREPTYSAHATAELVGCTYRQLDYWVRTGHVRPMVEAHGSGSRRRFSRRDVRAVRLVHQLRALGAPLHAIAGAAATLADSSTEWSGVVVVSTEGVVMDAMDLVVGLAPGAAGWIVDLAMWDER